MVTIFYFITNRTIVDVILMNLMKGLGNTGVTLLKFTLILCEQLKINIDLWDKLKKTNMKKLVFLLSFLGLSGNLIFAQRTSTPGTLPPVTPTKPKSELPTTRPNPSNPTAPTMPNGTPSRPKPRSEFPTTRPTPGSPSLPSPGPKPVIVPHSKPAEPRRDDDDKNEHGENHEHHGNPGNRGNHEGRHDNGNHYGHDKNGKGHHNQGNHNGHSKK